MNWARLGRGIWKQISWVVFIFVGLMLYVAYDCEFSTTRLKGEQEFFIFCSFMISFAIIKWLLIVGVKHGTIITTDKTISGKSLLGNHKEIPFSEISCLMARRYTFGIRGGWSSEESTIEYSDDPYFFSINDTFDGVVIRSYSHGDLFISICVTDFDELFKKIVSMHKKQ